MVQLNVHKQRTWVDTSSAQSDELLILLQNIIYNMMCEFKVQYVHAYTTILHVF